MSTSAAVPKPHSGAVYALLAIASIVGFLAIFALWAQRQLLNTDNFTQSSTQLLENPAIRATVADYLVDQLYANVDVTGELRTALPPQFQALAGPAAGGLRTLADKGANEALQRPRVQAAWENASRQAHLALLKVLNGGGPAVQTSGGVVTLDLGQVLDQITSRLGVGGRVAAKVPPGAAKITILRSNQLATAQDAVRGLRAIAIGLTALALGLFGVAIWLARGWRRQTLRAAGVLFVVIGVGALVVRKVAGAALVNSLATTDSVRPAIEAAWQIETSLLVAAAWAAIFYGVVAVIGAWAAGPTSVAVATRRGLAPYLRDPAWAWGGLTIVVLLVLAWGPTQALRQPVTALVLIAVVALGFEALRRQTAREFPDAERGSVLLRARSALDARRGARAAAPEPATAPAVAPRSDSVERLERVAALHERGALTDDEFAAEKADILAAH